MSNALKTLLAATDDPELYATLQTVADLTGVARHRLKLAVAGGELPSRMLKSAGYGKPAERVVLLSDVRAWQVSDTRMSRTARMFQLIMDGWKVDSICTELRMKRGAVLRAWQRRCKADPAFPARDVATDRISKENLSRDFSTKGQRRQGRSVAPGPTIPPWDETQSRDLNDLHKALTAAKSAFGQSTSS